MGDLKKSTPVSLGDIIAEREFHIPLYQRNYKWNTENAGRLADDLFEAYKSGNQKSVGLITLYEKEEGKRYDLIDGQQRFITLSIIINCLNSKDNGIDLIFDRDDKGDRKEALYGRICDNSTDVDRIIRNRRAIQGVLDLKLKDNGLDSSKGSEIIEYIKKNCMMLCSVLTDKPVDEFMNLNAYKTKFSVCDYVRANLIMQNTINKSFYEDPQHYLDASVALTDSPYKTGVAKLYNGIMDDLYWIRNGSKGIYMDLYKLLLDGGMIKNPEDTQESRINILFYDDKKVNIGDNYRYEPDHNTPDNPMDWLGELKKLRFLKRMLNDLKTDIENGHYVASKYIDNWQRLKKKTFLFELMNLAGQNTSLSLIELLDKYSKISDVQLGILKRDREDDLLANRFFEAFATYDRNEKIDKKWEDEGKKNKTPRTSDEEVTTNISNCGRYILDRFYTERRLVRNARALVSPYLDMTDKENEVIEKATDEENKGQNSGVGSTDSSEMVWSTRDLFSRQICIPVIQRDYCMGMQIKNGSKTSFLSFLLDGFDKKESRVASTILLRETKDKVYIFDGQQRSFTIYIILQYLGYTDLKPYVFVGRDDDSNREKYKCKSYDFSAGGMFAKAAAENLLNELRKEIDKRIPDDNKRIESREKYKRELKEYLWNNVTFIVKRVDTPSAAEQYFMDINGGVPLKPYEIFKACLYDRLLDLKNDENEDIHAVESFVDEFIRRVENEWLKAIYRLLDIKEEDQSDKEELVEMRLIEYLCRYFYRLKNIDQHPTSFDEESSMSDLVDRAKKYLNELTIYDFNCLEKILNEYLINTDILAPGDSGFKVRHNKKEFFVSANAKNEKKVSILSVMQLEKQSGNMADMNPNFIFKRFVESFSEERRIYLYKYYSCKDRDLNKKVYDRDQLIKYAIQRICTEGSKIRPEEIYDLYGTSRGKAYYFAGYSFVEDDYTYEKEDSGKVNKGSKDIKYTFYYHFNDKEISLPFFDDEIPVYYVGDLEWLDGIDEESSFIFRSNDYVGSLKKGLNRDCILAITNQEDVDKRGTSIEIITTDHRLKKKEYIIEEYPGHDYYNNKYYVYHFEDGRKFKLKQTNAYLITDKKLIEHLKTKSEPVGDGSDNQSCLGFSKVF